MTNESQGSIAVGIFSCSKVVAAYDAVRRLEAEQKHCRSKNNDQSSIVALEFKKFGSLHTYIEKLIDVEPSDAERGDAMKLYEKDTENRNRAKLGRGGKGAKLTDEEEQSIEVVKTWNVQAASAVCSAEKSISVIQESDMKAPAKFDSLCETFSKLKVQVIESIKAPSTVDVPTQFRYVKFMQENGVSPRILFAMDEFMARKLTDDDHPVAHALQKKLLYCEMAAASLGTPNQISDQQYFSTYKKLEEKDAKETRDTTFPNGLYVKGNKVVPLGTDGATEIIKPGGSLELNQMDGVKKGLLCLILLHWTSPTKDGKTDMGKGCITMANTVGPSYAHIEAGGEWTSEVIEQVARALGVHDFYDLVYGDKPSWGLQTNAFGDIVGLPEVLMELRGLQRQQAQILGNCLAGETTRVAVYSVEAQRRGYSFLGATGNTHVITCGSVAHTQAQQTPDAYMTYTNYSHEDLYNQSAAFTILFSPIEKLIVSATSQVMLIIACRTDEKKLTPEMKAIKDAALKKQRHENATKGGLTRSLTNKLSSAVFESSSNDLGDTSDAEDVTAVLEKLNSSPSSNNEASVVFEKLKAHKPKVLSQLPALSARLLNIERSRVKAEEKINRDRRERYAQKKQEAERIKAKPENKRSKDEKATLAKYEQDKAAENRDAREKYAQKKQEAERIEAKPVSKRGKGEKATLAAYEKEKAAQAAYKADRQDKKKKVQDAARKARLAAKQQCNLTNQWREFLNDSGYECHDVNVVPGSLDLVLTIGEHNTLRVASINDKSQLEGKISVNDVIFCMDDVCVVNYDPRVLSEVIPDMKNIKTLEIWRELV